MADSDDEYDRKRRDKFRGERSEYRGEGRREERPRREDWGDREQWNRSRGRTEYRRHEPRYSPVRSHDISPPAKRMRTDNWEESATQPAMLSFKAFLATQEDSISDQEAITKYNEYKREFKRQQLNEFFVSHREEEWFKIKYHPEECLKRKEEQLAALKRRMDVFMWLLDDGRLDDLTADADQTDKLVHLLDVVVVKLEGGTESDLKALEIEALKRDKPPEPKEEKKLNNKPSSNAEKKEDVKKEEPNSTSSPPPPTPEKQPEIINDDEELQKKAKDLLRQKNVPKKRKNVSDSSSDSSSSSSESENEEKEEEPVPPGLEDKSSESKEPGEVKDVENKPEETSKPEEKEKSVVVIIKKEKDEDGELKQSDGKKDDEDDDDDIITIPTRTLHKTCSIFLRSLAPTITKLEVECVCKRYPGFLRVAIADPQPERRWFRRGWVTFERNVNIKEICWSLNNIRLRDCELGAIMNRDLSRRIRTVNGITCHKTVVRSDIKLAARIVQSLDAKCNLWTETKEGEAEKEKKDDPTSYMGLSSRNPLLHNITDYLIEEASAEEEELLGKSAELDGNEGEGGDMERDVQLMQVLDRLVFYLRIVHSVDYYNHAEYPFEDEMPNRCGIMHARGTPPTNKVSPPELNDYITTFEPKVSPLLKQHASLVDEDCLQLGLKDPESEVEKFIVANSQELGKEKWLCPLSGKKFKGPEFIRKHIFNKHGEKVQEVKKEVEFYNNYLRDPNRPQLPEHPGLKTSRTDGGDNRERTQAPYSQGYQQYGGFGGNYGRPGGYNAFNVGYKDGIHARDNYRDYNRGRSAPFHRQGGMMERRVINYRDLDAPRDNEEF